MRGLLYIVVVSSLLSAVLGQDDAVFTQQGQQIRFLGKSAKFEITTGNNSTMRVSFGAIQELAGDGTQVNGHSIVQLASIQPTFEQGYMTSADSTNVTFIKMHLPLNSTGVQYKPSGCASPTVTQQDFNSGYLDIFTFFGFTNDTVFAYGYNNTLVAPANTVKFSIQALNWPFCSASNTLQLDLVLKTDEGQDAKPIATNVTADDSDTTDATTGSNVTKTGSEDNAGRRMRRLHQAAGVARKSGNGNGGNGNGNGNNDNGNKEGGTAGKGKGSHPKDPRVNGRKTDRVALLMDKASGKAATLDLESYAYDSANGTTLYNVTSTMLSQGDNTVVRLSFPAFTSIYYDPTLDASVDATNVGYTTTDLTGAKSAAGPVGSGIMPTLATAVLVLALL